MKINKDELLQLQKASSKNLKSFIKTFWHVLEPNNPLVDGWHLDAVCDHLTHIRELRNLLICLPPRFSKSLLLSFWFAWNWQRSPEERYIFASYNAALAEMQHERSRDLIRSELYQSFFPHVELRADSNTKQRIGNTKGGFRFATSLNGTMTGEGGDYIIGDDLHSLKEIDSKNAREEVIKFYTDVFAATRLNNPKTGCRLVIMQRGHRDDLAGFIINNDPLEIWSKLILPLQFDPMRRCKTSLPWRDPRTKKGELLCPARLGDQELNVLKNGAIMSSRAFEAQYNQKPQQDENSKFKREDFLDYRETETHYLTKDKEIDKKDCFRLFGIDLAISEKSSADESAIIIGDVAQSGEIFIKQVYTERKSAAKMLPTIEELNRIYKPDYVLVEDVGFQRAYIETLRFRDVPVKGRKPVGDKVSRATIAEMKVENHLIFLPEEATWKEKFLEQLEEFPNGKHDDIADSLSMIANEASARTRGYIAPLPPEEEAKRIKEAIEKRRFELIWGD